jgi:predicted RNase H-like nuclease/ppGpp synthetase/RelA/SpoT-type nucleotidyltranferase
VHHVGIDLAWGDNAPTGLAVLDELGRLVHVSAVRTDDEIEAALATYVEGACVVGIDAPLVVVNPTGKRPAEAALDADFRRFEAGTHPSNTGKKEFAQGTRGARVARRLGLDLDPRSGRERRAIEVYPHAATVALFRLGRTLKYKNKPGRTLESMRAELLVLVGHLDAQPDLQLGAAFDELRERIDDAARKSELRRVEDQVDAAVCALVARLADLRPDTLTTYGDAATGAIITPTLPPDLVPGAPHTDRRPTVQEAVQQYAADRPAREAAAAAALVLVTGLLDEAGINYLSVTGRAKTVASFAEKSTRTGDAGEGAPLYPDPLRDITDQVGVRVIAYVQSDVVAVADLLHAQVVVHDDRDLGRETAREGRFGYASRHLLIGVDALREAELSALAGRVVQVQLRTVLQHAWAEFEHDIRYKGSVPLEHVSEFDRRFSLAAGLLELADQEFTAIRERLRGTAPDDDAEGPDFDGPDDDPRIAPRELAAFLAGQYADAGWSRPDHYAWISGLVLELGIAGVSELGEVLRAADEPLIAERMDYRYPPGAVRRLDDALLATHGRRYVDLPGNAHRRELLEARLARLA